MTDLSDNTGPVPRPVVNRLSLYLREVEALHAEGVRNVSSAQLGRRLGVTDAQVRKDLAHFGAFGRRGRGYATDELAAALRMILGADQLWPAAMVGVGNLGRALLGYRGFERRGFRIEAVFDITPEVVGQTVEGRTIHHLDDLAKVLGEQPMSLAVLVVPGPAAQGVAERLVGCGVKGILNFAPTALDVPEDVTVVSVDLAAELQQLAFSVGRQPGPNPGQITPWQSGDSSV
jgi:redox-sensing transcriptional repressor